MEGSAWKLRASLIQVHLSGCDRPMELDGSRTGASESRPKKGDRNATKTGRGRTVKEDLTSSTWNKGYHERRDDLVTD